MQTDAWGEPLLTETRTTLTGQDMVDCVHLGGWAWVTAQGHCHYLTPQTPPVWLRSTAKPFQAVPMVQAFASAGRNHELTAAILAVASASHVGTPAHQHTVESLLSRVGLTADALHCGYHPPLHKPTRRHLQMQRIQAKESGEEPEPYSALGHNCSGNHAGLLAACVLNGWDIATYTHSEHPVQQVFLDLLSQWLGPDAVSGVATDGCGIPTVALSLSSLAQLFGAMPQIADMKPIVEAIAAEPVMFGGKTRVDSAIVQATGGKVIAKVGADGVIAASHVGKAEGLALKIAHGGELPRNRAFVTVLRRLGWLDAKACEHPVLVSLLDTNRRNGHGQLIGQLHHAK